MLVSINNIPCAWQQCTSYLYEIRCAPTLGSHHAKEERVDLRARHLPPHRQRNKKQMRQPKTGLGIVRVRVGFALRSVGFILMSRGFVPDDSNEVDVFLAFHPPRPPFVMMTTSEFWCYFLCCSSR